MGLTISRPLYQKEWEAGSNPETGFSINLRRLYPMRHVIKPHRELGDIDIASIKMATVKDLTYKKLIANNGLDSGARA